MTRSLRFIHTSDIHLDGPIRDLRNPVRSAERRREFRDALRRIAEGVREEQADLLLIAGDFLEHETVRKQTVEWAKELLGKLPCTVLISPGNHDTLVPDSYYYTTWPANVHIFRNEDFDSVRLDELGVVVHGLGWQRSHWREPRLRGFRVPEDGYRHIVMIHGDTFDVENTEYLPITREDLLGTGADYVALGHFHNFRVFEEGGRPVAAYSGSPEPMRFRETGEHGFIVGQLGEFLRLRFVPAARRQFHQLRVDVSGCAHEEALLDILRSADSSSRRQRDFYRIALTGRVDPELQFHLAELEVQLRDEFYYVELTDETQPDYDLEGIANGPDSSLQTLFVRRLLGELECAGSEEKHQLVRKALEYGLEALLFRRVTLP